MATGSGAAAGGRSFSFKVVLLGEGCVGKTSLVLRYCENKFNDKHITTLQVRAGPGAGGPARSYGDGAGGGGVRCSPSLARSPGCPAGAGPRGPAALPRPGPVERSSVSPRQDLGLVCRLTAGGGTAAALEGVPVPFRVSWKLTFWIFLRLRL